MDRHLGCPPILHGRSRRQRMSKSPVQCWRHLAIVLVTQFKKKREPLSYRPDREKRWPCLLFPVFQSQLSVPRCSDALLEQLLPKTSVLSTTLMGGALGHGKLNNEDVLTHSVKLDGLILAVTSAFVSLSIFPRGGVAMGSQVGESKHVC